MRLYLVRHGESVTPEIDPNQPLSEWGKTEVNQMAHFLAQQKLSLDTLYHSAKLRAKETAELIGSEIAPHLSLKERPGLKPLDPIAPLLPELQAWEGSVMLVSHLPFLEKLLSTLLFGEESEGVFELTGGTVLCLQRDGQKWKLKWHLTPQLVMRVEQHL